MYAALNSKNPSRGDVPNPLYIFDGWEANALGQIFMPKWYRDARKISFGNISLNPAYLDRPYKGEAERTYGDIVHARLFYWKCYNHIQKIILMTSTPTTLQTPHHIHEDGSMEEHPGRKGPFRTYYDGSSIKRLGHAVVVTIDKKQGTITTQCPKGKDFSARGEELLGKVFAGYERITIRADQQKDQHSCVPISLYNAFAAAGIVKVKTEIDINAWRGELLRKLELHEAATGDVGDQIVQLRQKFGYKVPIYAQRYVPALS